MHRSVSQTKSTQRAAQTSLRLTVLKVELVEVHALHQVSQRFGLKRGQSGVTDSPVTQNQTHVNQNNGDALVFVTFPPAKLIRKRKEFPRETAQNYFNYFVASTPS